MTDEWNPASTTAADASAATAGADATRLIDVILTGGPANLSEDLRTRRVTTDESKLKVLHYGGYEHFERDPATVRDGKVVFRWTGRTRIAE